MKTVPHNFTPRDYQLNLFRALDSTTKPVNRACLRWHRRAGKDTACYCYMIKEAYQKPGNYFYIFPTKEEARKALWEKIDNQGFRTLEHLPEEIVTRKSNQEMSFEIESGKYLYTDKETGHQHHESKSTIRLIGLDKNPDSIRGVSAKGVVISEYAYSDAEAFKIIAPSVRESGGWVIFNSTPNGRNHYFDLWQNVESSPRWYVSELQTYWPDLPNYSGLVSPESLLEIKNEEGYTDEDMEREYGVSFNTGLKGSYYIDCLDTAREDGRIGTYLYDETKPVSTFWDIGVSDATVCWFAQEVGNTLVFIDYWEGVGNSIDTLVRMLASKEYDYKSHYFPHDAAPGRLRREENLSVEDDFNTSLNDFKVTGMVEVLEKPSKKQIGIMAVRRAFPLFCFDSGKCAVGIRHLELYHKNFDKKNNTFRDEPVHDEHSHAADALRLVAESRDYRHPTYSNPSSNYKVTRTYNVWD